jgi:prevent-host-death family protein
MTNSEVSVAEAKKNFSELLGRVAYGRERIVISKRGRPMAVLVPVSESRQQEHLSNMKGWLDQDDPFFDTIDRVIEDRVQHAPRVLGE